LVLDELLLKETITQLDQPQANPLAPGSSSFAEFTKFLQSFVNCIQRQHFRKLMTLEIFTDRPIPQ
jgi:hypothetical protein